MKRLLSHKGYRRYLTGTAIASFGNGMYFVAIAWLLLSLDGKVSSISTLLVVSSIPGIVLSPSIGVLIDRWDRRLVCAISDGFRSLCLIVLVCALYLWTLETWQVYVVAFLLSTAERFYMPADSALVRELISKDELAAANSLCSVVTQSGLLIGTGAAGFLIHALGTKPAIFVNGITFLLSAGFMIGVRKGIVIYARDLRTGIYQEFLAGLSYLRDTPRVIHIGVLQFFVLIALYTTNVLLPVFTQHTLRLGAKEFGLIDSAWAAGSIVSGAYLLRTVSGKSSLISIDTCMLLLGSSMIVFLTSNSLSQAVSGYFCMGLFFAACRILLETFLQTEVPVYLQGRVKSTISMGTALIGLPIYLLVGYFGDATSTRFVYVIVSGAVLVGAGFAFSLRRNGHWTRQQAEPLSGVD